MEEEHRVDPDNLLTHIENQDRAEKFRNRVENLEKRIGNATGADFIDISEDILLYLDQTDDFIIDLQERRDKKEKKLKRERQRLPVDDVEKEGDGGYHLTVKEIKELIADLREHERQINDWKGYQLELLDLFGHLNYDLSRSYHQDNIDKQAAESVLDLAEEWRDEAIQYAEKAVEAAEEKAELKIDRRLTDELGDLKMTQMEVKKELEFYRRMNADLVATLQDVAGAQRQVEALLDIVDDQTEMDIDEAREQVEEAADAAAAAAEQMDDPEGYAIREAQEHLPARPEQLEPDGSVEEGDPEASGVADEDEEGDVSGGEEERPLYRLKEKSLSEMKEEFDRMEEDHEPQYLTFRKMAEKSDVSAEAVRQKLNKVRDEFGEDVGGSLGKN